MKKFAKRQELLKFQCACHWCKHGKAPDLEAYDEFEKLNQEREKLAMQRGSHSQFFFSWPFIVSFIPYFRLLVSGILVTLVA